MTFASTITRTIPNIVGDRKITHGTYTNASGDTGGNIDTGLQVCEHIQLQPTGTAVIASNPVVNETLPIDGSAITIVTTDNEDGIWIAYGY